MAGPRAALAALAAAVAMAAFYGLYWSYVAGRFQAGIEAWAAARAVEGYRVSYGRVRVTGFPFRIEAVVTEPAIADFAGAQPWSWRGPGLTVRARPWRPSRMRG
ncbi:MAG: DUF2125 domain-containing protein, partial [Rhodospirillales bacterium]